jgi:chemotaxis signal transduction protein
MNDGERAQGIRCDGLAVALPYAWARGVVDSFELSGVPNAPGWLAGAANVDGRILAVVDLARWARPDTDTQPPPASPARQRLLVGGDGPQAFALRFQGLPALLRCGPATPAPTADTDLPEALAPFVRGTAQADGQAAAWPVLDMPGLARAWAAELAT